MKIRDICTDRVVTVLPNATVEQASIAMRNAHVGCVVVVEPDGAGIPRPVGIVTDRDIVVAILAPGARPSAISVGDLMSRELAVVHEDDGIFEASHAMAAFGVRRLPVVTADGSLAGIVTSDDLMAVLSAELRNIADAQARSVRQEKSERAAFPGFNRTYS